MKATIKRTICMLLAAVMVLSVVGMFKKPEEVKAAGKYMTAKEFLILLEDEMMLPVEKGNFDSYIEMALFTKIIDKSTFKNYNKNITVAQAATMMAKADEYLFGKKISDEDAKFIIENRISDIKKAKKADRVWVAKAYGLGYLSGKSNGTWSTDRKLSLKYKVKAVNAKAMIKRLANKDERFVLSPDYQMTRTTNLPYMHEWYPYILASYPNKYYDVQFNFQRQKPHNTYYSGNIPAVNFLKGTNMLMWFKHGMGEDSNKHLYLDPALRAAVDEAIEFYTKALNTNYKKIDKDKEWQRVIKNVIGEDRYKRFVELAKENKSIVTCDRVACDVSSFHYNVLGTGTGFTIRVYAHYKVVSDKGVVDDLTKLWSYVDALVPSTNAGDTLLREHYKDNRIKDGRFSDYKNGEWREGIFEVDLRSSKWFYTSPGVQELSPTLINEALFQEGWYSIEGKVNKYMPYDKKFDASLGSSAK